MLEASKLFLKSTSVSLIKVSSSYLIHKIDENERALFEVG